MRALDASIQILYMPQNTRYLKLLSTRSKRIETFKYFKILFNLHFIVFTICCKIGMVKFDKSGCRVV